MNGSNHDRFIAGTWEQLTLADAELASLADAPLDANLVNRILLRVREIEKTCQPFGLVGVRSIATRTARLVAQLRDGSLKVGPDTVSLLRESTAAMKELVGWVEATGAEPDTAATDIITRLEKATASLVPRSLASAEKPTESSVLVVDDSMFFRHLVTAALESRSYTVAAVESASSAVSLLQAGKSFRAIVSEVEIPEMSGCELANWLRNRRGEMKTPIIALTANGSAAQRSRALNAGFDCFLIKFNAKQLYYAMVDVLSSTVPSTQRKCA